MYLMFLASHVIITPYTIPLKFGIGSRLFDHFLLHDTSAFMLSHRRDRPGGYVYNGSAATAEGAARLDSWNLKSRSGV
jgi:hypothetical protein